MDNNFNWIKVLKGFLLYTIIFCIILYFCGIIKNILFVFILTSIYILAELKVFKGRPAFQLFLSMFSEFLFIFGIFGNVVM